jgi:hypothetical protein
VTAKIENSTKDYLLATWQHVFLALFRGETSVDAVRDAQRVFDQHMTANPEGVLLLTIVEQGAPMPEASARNEIGKLLRSGAGRTKKSAVVYEGDGFRAAAVRSVVTGLAVFSKPPYPHKIFGKVSEAAGFLADPSKGVTGNQLATIVSEVRARHLEGLKSAG